MDKLSAVQRHKIWLEEHAVIGKPYPKQEEEDNMLKAAEDSARR